MIVLSFMAQLEVGPDVEVPVIISLVLLIEESVRTFLPYSSSVKPIA